MNTEKLMKELETCKSENQMRKVFKIISNMKLIESWGETGNDY